MHYQNHQGISCERVLFMPHKNALLYFLLLISCSYFFRRQRRDKIFAHHHAVIEMKGHHPYCCICRSIVVDKKLRDLTDAVGLNEYCLPFAA